MDHGDAARNWKSVASKALLCSKEEGDPWGNFRLEDLHEEKCSRLCYDATCQEWKEDCVIIQIEANPFAKGAMRQCFRMRETKVLDGPSIKDWEVLCANARMLTTSGWKAQTNKVAKEYIGIGSASYQKKKQFEMVEKLVRQDVKMQMEAKLIANRYNMQQPPKPVDILECHYLISNTARRLLFVENYVEGEYVKHNNNAGYVCYDADFLPQRNQVVLVTEEYFTGKGGRQVGDAGGDNRKEGGGDGGARGGEGGGGGDGGGGGGGGGGGVADSVDELPSVAATVLEENRDGTYKLALWAPLSGNIDGGGGAATSTATAASPTATISNFRDSVVVSNGVPLSCMGPVLRIYNSRGCIQTFSSSANMQANFSSSNS